jgi:hypothetical protein
MSWEEWLTIGLAAWCVLSVVTGLLIGPVLRRSRLAMEAADQDFIDTEGRAYVEVN